MYEEFYGFSAKPFNKTPDPKFLFLSRSHEEALARLQFSVEERDII
ncbi:MAG: ATPase, partial [Desulfobacterales bacterium]|nr:ATPase [Desulfobacterales bacterium]